MSELGSKAHAVVLETMINLHERLAKRPLKAVPIFDGNAKSQTANQKAIYAAAEVNMDDLQRRWEAFAGRQIIEYRATGVVLRP